MNETAADKEALTTLNDELVRRNRELKELNAALIDSEAKFRSLAKSATDAIVTTNGRGEIGMWNEAAERLFGYSETEAVGCNVTMTMPARFREAHLRGMSRVLATGETHVIGRTVELVGLRKDGREFPLELSLSQWSSGNEKFFTAIMRDVSERKRAEENLQRLASELELRVKERTRALERSEERHRFLAEASAVLSTASDHRRVLQLFANLVVLRFSDVCLVHIPEGDGQFACVAFAHREPALAGLQDFAELKFPVGAAVLERLRVKSHFTVEMRSRDRALGALTFAFTEAERAFSEDDAAVAKELARRAASAVDNCLLLLTAQDANRIKDEFLATLSHELRTPMNVILGWIEILQRNRDPHTVEEALDPLERNSKLQIRLINDLLDVSRIITGKLHIEKAVFNLNEVVAAAVASFSVSAQTLKIRLGYEDKAADLTVFSDATRVSQVLNNIISNALKFTPEGGEVKVILLAEGGKAVVAIKDSGVGISHEFLPHVFDTFRQEDGSTARKYGGLGLGLAVSRHIIQQHGGAVEAFSEGKGKGSEFRVILPLASGASCRAVDSAADCGHATSAAISGTEQDKRPLLQGSNILAVDDSVDILRLLQRKLGRFGAHVHIANSAQAAFAQLQTERFDLILCDIGMPEEDGLSFIRRVRKMEGAPSGVRQIPAVALTAYARTEEVEEALSAGFHSHLAKPVSEGELVAVITKLLKSAQPSVPDHQDQNLSPI